MRRPPDPRGDQAGQSLVLVLGAGAAVVAGSLLLGAFGSVLGQKGRHQRGAALATISAARAMRDAYPRLFEPARLRPGVPNPRHLSHGAYLRLARSAAVRAARANGVAL